MSKPDIVSIEFAEGGYCYTGNLHVHIKHMRKGTVRWVLDDGKDTVVMRGTESQFRSWLTAVGISVAVSDDN